jgi:hypothetical protein
MEEERIIRGELLEGIIRITLMCMKAREQRQRNQHQ